MKHINPIVSGQEEQEGNKRKSKNISEVHQGKISTSHNYKQSYLKTPTKCHKTNEIRENVKISFSFYMFSIDNFDTF
jgi:general stress protein 26